LWTQLEAAVAEEVGMSFARQIVPGRTYLITRRCTQRQFLLRPDEETNNAFVYCYAYAAAKTGIETVAFIANSNHYHAVVVDRLGQVPVFLELFHKLLAKHQNRLRGREENFWASQQTSLVELVDETDVIDKVIYTLCNPVKDHLVERANEWPGATSLPSTLEGKSLRATRPARFFRAKGKMPSQVTLNCVRPPSLVQAEERDYRTMLSQAIASVERDAADERKRRGFSVLGAKAILAQSPPLSRSNRGGSSILWWRPRTREPGGPRLKVSRRFATATPSPETAG
jgi:putative transposase